MLSMTALTRACVAVAPVPTLTAMVAPTGR